MTSMAFQMKIFVKISFAFMNATIHMAMRDIILDFKCSVWCFKV